MPVYEIKLRRQVTRTVTLDQEAYVFIRAATPALADKAADQLQYDDDLDEHCSGWQDKDSSRQASSDRDVTMMHRYDEPRAVTMMPRLMTALDAKTILNLEE